MYNHLKKLIKSNRDTLETGIFMYVEYILAVFLS